MALDLRVPIDVLLEAFGVPATVTRPVPDDTPIVTSGIWTDAAFEVPAGGEFTRQENRRVLSFDRAVVGTMPRQTAILAPERKDLAILGWRVDGTAYTDSEMVGVWVVRDESLDP